MSSHDIQPRDLVEQGSRYGIILSMSTEKLLREFVRRALHEEVRRKFEMYIPDDLRDIAAMFKSAGHQLFVVGGSVRDALLGKDPKDYDVATDAVPDTVSEILSSDPTLKVLEIGKSFGVVKVVTPEKNEYEIATFRKETYLNGDDKDEFVKFIKAKGPTYEKRLNLFIDRSRNF